MIDERAQVASARVAPAGGLSLGGVFRFLRVDRSRGVAVANLGLALAIVLNGLMGLLFLGDPIEVVAWWIPFVGFFYIMARLLSRGDHASERVLRISGFASLLMVPMSISSLSASLQAPVDVACVFAASGFTAAFLWAGVYQVHRSGALRS